MFLENPTATWPPWPPEVPPLRPPERPAPQPVLPSWLEPEPVGLDRDVADRLLQQRVIVVGGRLDDSVASRVAAQLLLLDTQEATPITLHLACTDADLEPSLALAGAIDLVQAPVHAVVRGTLRGPAVAVLCAAQQRAAHQHTMFVLLSPQFSGEGTAAELATLADQHERQVARLRDLIVRATGRTTQEVAADLDAGRVLGADEAKDYGLVSQLL
ncbi:ATP-dependent Clp protease protease subunit [Kribbella sp. VKM Ac-2527]|uniref:ATP-dependent Clp protease proteolytic subunit n=1 Tax=Kribbella caucasensis TaxID=2512215 RepID=A0A4R6KF98_9ACTN|nr:ATP-dependent Clp protease proteolytic subunit [Kribbella sp. VKM Ac-2527]TDO46766.1 ATP-dependent Clp protease protease subunit [Kribbella sp. VKM Ac-2527]